MWGRALGTVALALALDAIASGVVAQRVVAQPPSQPGTQPTRVAVDWSAVRDQDIERCGLSRLRAGTIERLIADGHAVVEATDASGVRVAVRSANDGLAVRVEGAGAVRHEELHAGTPCDPTFALDVVSRIAELVSEVAALAAPSGSGAEPAGAAHADPTLLADTAKQPERASWQAALDLTARLNTAPDYQLGSGISVRARLGDGWESGLRAELTAHAAHDVTVLEAFFGLTAALQPDLPGVGPYLELGPVLHVGNSDERSVTRVDGALAAGAQVCLGHFLGQLLVYGRLHSLEHRVGRKTAFETGHLGVLLRLGAQLSDS